MKKIAIVVCLGTLAAACGRRGAVLTGTVQVQTDLVARADSGARIDLYSLQDSGRKFAAFSDANGAYRIDGLDPGQYLLIAESRSGKQSAIGLLREFVLVSKELQSMTGYDAVSNMTDELKAAIAFGDENIPALSSDSGSAKGSRPDSLANAFLAGMPPGMQRFIPLAGNRAVALQKLSIGEGTARADGILFH